MWPWNSWVVGTPPAFYFVTDSIFKLNFHPGLFGFQSDFVQCPSGGATSLPVRLQQRDFLATASFAKRHWCGRHIESKEHVNPRVCQTLIIALMWPRQIPLNGWTVRWNFGLKSKELHLWRLMRQINLGALWKLASSLRNGVRWNASFTADTYKVPPLVFRRKNLTQMWSLRMERLGLSSFGCWTSAVQQPRDWTLIDWGTTEWRVI